jgi:hypothetical protein
MPWQTVESQLTPQAGSQNWPGHHIGAGCAAASPTPPTPVSPEPAAIATVAITRAANFVMPLHLLPPLCPTQPGFAARRE